MIFAFCVFSFFAMLSGGICAYLHGLYSRDSKKIAERLAEFGRNAFIQVSAMLFALATALYVFENQNIIKTKEQAYTEKSIAYSAIAIRAGLIENKVKSFVVSSRIDIPLPACLYEDQKRGEKLEQRPATDIADDCKSLILQAAQTASQRYSEYRLKFDTLSDALNLKEDWIKYPYFSHNLDRAVLQKFLDLQAILNYRDAEAMRVLAGFRAMKPEQFSLDKIVYDITRYNNAIDRYSKTSIIYLIMYYLSFGEIDRSSDLIEKKQKDLIEDVRANFEMYDRISINQFANTISLRS